jgi:putative transcriptional regulator
MTQVQIGGTKSSTQWLRPGDVPPVPRYEAGDLLRIRLATRLSPAEFSDKLGVAEDKYRAWEEGSRKPRGPVLRLLQIVDKNGIAILS